METASAIADAPAHPRLRPNSAMVEDDTSASRIQTQLDQSSSTVTQERNGNEGSGLGAVGSGQIPNRDSLLYGNLNNEPRARSPEPRASDEAPEWKKNLDKIETWFNWAAFLSNALGPIPLLMKGFSEKAKKRIENVVNTVLNLSFMVYGASGVSNGVMKKNIFQVLGFLGEMIFPWFGQLKYTYVLRGLPTGMDQLWVATDPRLGDKYKDGKFDSYGEGFREMTKTCWQILEEVWKNPMAKILTKDTSGGHHALLSSLGSALASIGYMLTKNENIFGHLRDAAAPFFDWAMLLDKMNIRKFSGSFFILETIFDLLARPFKHHWTRIALNMWSHACGRLALKLYKDSDSVAT